MLHLTLQAKKKIIKNNNIITDLVKGSWFDDL